VCNVVFSQKKKLHLILEMKPKNVDLYAGYFTSDNEPDGTENATHNTLPKKPDIKIKIIGFF
jgi:hypothetical protein